jgi:DNA-binding CsgD family transcriptional regulator
VVDEDTRPLTDELLAQRLWDLRQATELPVVFGGLTRPGQDGQQLLLSGHLGTRGTALRGLVVPSGRGLGGAAIARGRPLRVADYASNRAITHEFDDVVVRDERITSIFAFPVLVHGRVHGVLYGAVREGGRQIDAPTLQVARLVTARLERELRPEPGAGRARPAAAPPRRLSLRERTALDDLAVLVRRVHDPSLRDQLARIHRELSGTVTPATPAARPTAGLAPREIDVLRLVAIGASNIETAGQLGLSAETVKAYLRSAMRKLGVHNRGAAVHAARTAGVI